MAAKKATKDAVKRPPKPSIAPDSLAPFEAPRDLSNPPRLQAVAKPVWNPADLVQGETVFSLLANGDTVTSIVDGFSGCSVWKLLRWFDSTPENSQAYARAREQRAHAIANRIYDMAAEVVKGNVDPNAARVALDAFKWTASKMLPKHYGDKLELGGGVQLSLVTALQELSAQPVLPTPQLPGVE